MLLSLFQLSILPFEIGERDVERLVAEPANLFTRTSLGSTSELPTNWTRFCGPANSAAIEPAARHNSTPRDDRAALCQVPALLHRGLRLMLHKNPETEYVRHQQ